MKKVILILIAAVALITANARASETDEVLKRQFNCGQITSDPIIKPEKLEEKKIYLTRLNKIYPPYIRSIKFIRGNRAFYNTASNDLLIPVDTPNFYLDYAVYHEIGHVIYRRFPVQCTYEFSLIQEAVWASDISEYAKTNAEEYFCELVAYYEKGKDFGHAVKSELDTILSGKATKLEIVKK